MRRRAKYNLHLIVTALALSVTGHAFGQDVFRFLPGEAAVVAAGAPHVAELTGAHDLRPSVPTIVPLPAVRSPAREYGAFGSVAISSKGIPAAAKWRPVLAAAAGSDIVTCLGAGSPNCRSPLARQLKSLATAVKGMSERARLQVVNRVVNDNLRYASDSTIWSITDYWATPAEILARGYGDCEDYAIAKYWLLRELGYDAEQLQLVVLLETRRNLFHAVLAVHSNGRRYVLDNLTASVKTDAAFASYLPIMSFVGDRSFIHGFRDKRAEVAQLPSDLASIAPGGGL